MKKIYSFISALTLSLSVSAQAPVPTAYDFENGGTYPLGWTLNPLGAGTQYYTTTNACGGSAYSLKFDSPGATTGENLVINLVSQPGLVTFNIRANTGAVTPWSGTFEVQESISGTATTYTTIKQFTGSAGLVNAPTSCVTHTALPTNPNSKYIRFIYVAKTTGNVCLDDITIASPNVAVGIKVKQGVTQISNGGFINPIATAVSSTILLPLILENFGTSSTLSITSVAITGANAGEFVSISSPVVNIAPSANSTFSINFTPSTAGTRTATATFTTNDPNNTSFVVNLYGVGGTLATAPSVQANALTFPLNKTYRIKGQFNTVNSSLDALGGYLILRKTGGMVSDIPVNGTAYSKGQYIGASQVVYQGSINNTIASFVPSFIRANTTYGFAIYTYNGSGSATSYNLTAPLNQLVVTPATMMPANEYASINVNNASFLTNLSALINPHTPIFYSNYAATMIDKFETRDTLITSPVVFTKVVNCSYSGQTRPYNDPFDWTALDFSREHTYCHNWMPTNPADNPEKPEYNDQHHLYPTKQINVNATRSNYPLGEVVTQSSSFLNSKFGTNASGQQVYEPRNQHKGNAARAIMYMATAYNGISGNNWKLRNPISATIPYGQDQNLLKKWHFQDLPDSYEISRNDYLDSLQGNRNPFIDSVRYACYIDFSNMTYIAAPTYTTGANAPCYVAVGIKENVATHFEYVLAPNPTKGEFYLLLDAKVAEQFIMTVQDVTGRTLYAKPIDVNYGFNNITVNDLKLASGIYFVDITYKNEKVTRKLIIE